VTRLPDNQAEHLARLAAGDRLIGPVKARAVGNAFITGPWGFAGGGRAHAQTVARLAARGLVTIVVTPSGHEARLP
jgi:hypothetical protein